MTPSNHVVERDTGLALEALRKELIDVGKSHNALINFRPRRLSVDAVAFDIDGLFKSMVGDMKTVRLLHDSGKPDPMLGEIGDVPGTAAPKSLSVNRLQSKLERDELDLRLRRISYEARSQTQELGFHSLYLAIGFLTYFANNDLSKPIRAPLILLPVDVTRQTNSSHSMAYNEADFGPNVALRESLKSEFDVDLPDVDENTVPSESFDRIERNVRSRALAWEVHRQSVHLGFFSFASYVMYNDLDPASWPDEQIPAKHPILQWLLTSRSGRPPSDSPAQSNGAFHNGWPADLVPLVLDADSSQISAINEVIKGSNLVVDGPPGTGKSQTIANLIARYAAEGKRVLFVADKLAALEVVKNRLDEAGIGEIALELHSHRGNKKQVIEQLKSVSALPPVPSPDVGGVKQRYLNLFDRLTGYADAVNGKILRSGRSFVEIGGDLNHPDRAQLDPALVGHKIDGIERLSQRDLDTGLDQLRDLTAQRDLTQTPRKDIYRNLANTEVTPADLATAVSEVASAIGHLREACRSAEEIADELGMASPTNLKGIDEVNTVATVALGTPSGLALEIGHPLWKESHERVMTLLEIGPRFQDVNSQLIGKVSDRALQTNFSYQLIVWETKGRSWFRLFNREYRYTKRFLSDMLGTEVANDYRRCRSLLLDIQEHQALKSQFQELLKHVRPLFTADLNIEQEDWDELNRTVDWVYARRDDQLRPDRPDT